MKSEARESHWGPFNNVYPKAENLLVTLEPVTLKNRVLLSPLPCLNQRQKNEEASGRHWLLPVGKVPTERILIDPYTYVTWRLLNIRFKGLYI